MTNKGGVFRNKAKPRRWGYILSCLQKQEKPTHNKQASIILHVLIRRLVVTDQGGALLTQSSAILLQKPE